MSVVVTRSEDQASALSDALVSHGAEPVQVAMIAIVEPDDGGAALRRAAQQIGEYGQLVVSSPNGARVLVQAVEAVDAPVADVPPVACVGPSTAAVVAEAGLRVNVVPDRSVAEGLVQAMPAPANGDRLLLVQAAVARPVLEQGLTGLGWKVDRVVGYQTVDARPKPADLERIGFADAVIFTSSSTVERFVRLVGHDRLPPLVVSIGPITSATARELGVVVDFEAATHTLDGVVAALVDGMRSR